MNVHRPVREALPGIMILLAVLTASIPPAAAAPPAAMSFLVSMDNPNAHLFHVVFRCEGLAGETQDFKMPAWTPGYYQIMNYAKNVLRFKAEDGEGRPLPWEKTDKATWRVRSRGAAVIVVSYDVFAFTRFVAESCLDDTQGFISPTGVFMHVGGRIRQPVTVTIKPFAGWTRVSTGLDPAAGRPNTFIAPDFDALYDGPILVGNQEVLDFEVRGIPHRFAGRDLGNFDRGTFVADLKRMIEASADLMGEIPYRHYTFISIGPGRGGLEHGNSSVLSFDGSGLATPAGRETWLSFVCHEYFHLYNVKRIRPLALGPFDYERENYTRLLWVSEGLSVYYERLILNRAGLLSREAVLRGLASDIRAFENAPGHAFQSAAQASFDAWLQSYTPSGNAANTTISYYDKGSALGLLLDLKIRQESGNRRSLDDAMRALYRVYYKEKQRGFTDQEFRRACEEAAGVPLPEIFEVYASTTGDIDYPKYLAYAGLGIDVQASARPGAWFGAATRERNGASIISSVEADSPAARAGLSVEDEIIALDGGRVGPETPAQILARRKPGETVRVLISRRGEVREIAVVLDKKMSRSFAISLLPNPSPLQADILAAWLK